MDFPLNNLSSFHSELLANTELGRLCGQEELFRKQYQIIRIIGRGGFGVTFLAKDMRLPNTPYCVIKLLCPKVSSLNALETARLRFEREAKTLSKLGSHSQIPMLMDYFVLKEEFYLVQEYVQGGTLARLIRRNGPISEQGVRQFLQEMLPLLHYIHSNKVIHRDIKPQNIIRCQHHRRLVLIDFGAVKEQIAQVEDTSMKGMTTHFIGTVGFAPPEQFALRSVYSSDIYALGITCLYLLSGVGPLDFETDRQTGKILWQKKLKVSPELGTIIDQMIQPSPRDRFPTARSIIVALHGNQLASNMSECLAAPPSSSFVDESPPENEHSYQSPHSKAAIAIREWKQKMQQRQPKTLTSTSSP
jgi:serine/threonine-protein kinase